MRIGLGNLKIRGLISLVSLLKVGFLIFAGMFILASGPNQTPDSPNIIFILTDDQGWAHVSHRAHPDVSNSINEYYETPVLDQMAKSGLMFTQGYAPNPICAPTRNSILFGQNAARHIYSNDEDWYKKTNEWPTIPKVLKESNPDYQTAHFGMAHCYGAL